MTRAETGSPISVTKLGAGLPAIMRVASRGDAALFSSLLQQAALLVSGVGSAWLIGDSGRGQLAYGMTVGTIAGLFAVGGWSSAAALGMAGRWGPQTSAMAILKVVAVRRAFVAALLAMFGMVPFRQELGDALVPIVLGAVAAAVGLVTVQFLVGIAQGQGKAGRANVLRTSISVAYAAPIVILIGFQLLTGVPVTVSALAVAWIISWSIPILIGISLLWRPRRAGRRKERDPRLLAQMRSNSRTSFIGSLSFYELLRADQLVAVVVLSTVDLGQYVVAMSFTGLLKALGQALGVSVLSLSARSQDARVVERRLAQSIGLIAIAVVVVGAAMWPVFHWLLPDEFEPALLAAAILVAASAVSATRRVLVEYAKGLGHPLGSSAAEIAFVFILVALVASGAVASTTTGLAMATLAGCIGGLAVSIVSTGIARRLARRSVRETDG